MSKILIVDDNLTALKEMVERLEEKGYEVEKADSKEEAIEIIRESAVFDVAVVDMKLREEEEEGGLKVVKAVRLKDSFTQIIVLTAYGSLENVRKAMEFGIWQYIDKKRESANDILYSQMEKALEHKNLILEKLLGRHKEEIPEVKKEYRRSLETEMALLEGLKNYAVPEGLITEKQLEDALKEQEEKKISLEKALINNRVEEGSINWTLSKQLNVPYIYLIPETIDTEVVQNIPEEILRVCCLIPIAKIDNQLTVVIADPNDSQSIELIETITGCQVKVFLGSPKNIMETINKILGGIGRKKLLQKFNYIPSEEEV
ncbi:MAG: response regulator [bacterium]|nr:response regulator [bacterium]